MTATPLASSPIPFITDSRDWRLRATCRSVDPDLFFPVSTPGSDRYAAEVAEAKQVCGNCPVRARCLEVALGIEGKRDRFGVAGGLDQDERTALRHRRDAERKVAAAAEVPVALAS